MINRKDFLKMTAWGGLGALFGGAALAPAPASWRDRGAKLMAVERSSLLMGSVVTFQAVAESERAGYEAIRKAVEVFRKTDNLFSMYRADSEMALLKREAGISPVRLSGEAMEVLGYAKELYQKSGGLFDVTVEPAMREWGFREGPGAAVPRPGSAGRKELVRLIGSDKLALDPGAGTALLAEAGMAIDTGGIAGGYALDRAIEAMKTCGIASAFINFSGDIHTFGEPLHGQEWPVYILDSGTGEPQPEPVLLKDAALSTSGNYRNRRHGEEGEDWGHLLNTRSAEPLRKTGSVTAIHASAMAADAWSTAVYLGAHPEAAEPGLRLLYA